MANGVNHARAGAAPAAVERVRKALREHGSGVPTQIDVRQTLRAKPNTDTAEHVPLAGLRVAAGYRPATPLLVPGASQPALADADRVRGSRHQTRPITIRRWST